MVILDKQPGARVTGPVQIFKSRGSGRLAYLYEFHTAFRQKENAAMGVCVTANLIVARETLQKVGRFNDKLMSGGDFEWNRRAQAIGVPLVFDPEVLVSHPSRPNLDEIFRKKKRIARSDATQKFHPTLPYVWAQIRPPLKRLKTGRKFNSPLSVMGLLAISWTLNVYAALQFLCVRVGFCSLTRT
jgi:GT2 family glycosyltransferase